MLWSTGLSMTPDIIDLHRSNQVSGRNRVRSTTNPTAQARNRTNSRPWNTLPVPVVDG